MNLFSSLLCLILVITPIKTDDDDLENVLDVGLNRYEQDDPRLIEILQREKRVVKPPKWPRSQPKLVWATSAQNMMGQFEQARVVDDLYK